VISLGAKQLVASIERSWGTIAADPSLASGSAGLALTISYLSSAFKGQGYDVLATDLLRQTISTIESRVCDWGLLSGYAGIGWVFDLIGHQTMSTDLKEIAGDIDAIIESALTKRNWTTQFDLATGLTGIGLYCLHRCPRDQPLKSMTHVLRHLRESAVSYPGGLAWLGSPNAHDPQAIDLGMAHGQAGVITFLSSARAVEGAPYLPIEGLLLENVSWLTSQFQPDPGSTSWHLPSLVLGDGTLVEGRQGWCYGDPGVSISLWNAGSSMANSSIKQCGLQVGLRAAHQILAATTLDAGLCHGSSGLFIIFNHFYNVTREDTFMAAAHRCLESTIQHITAIYTSPPELRPMDIAFLSGLAGDLLLLVSIAFPPNPPWEALFLGCPRMI